MTVNTQAHVIISGCVQGVFFRAETQRTAQQLGVTGWVRNLRDGTVEALFEGPSQAVQQAIDWCWQGSPMSKVRDVKIQMDEYKGSYEAFSIRY
jgi:acylphosphatase